jgi:histidine triad (HIT) family protein
MSLAMGSSYCADVARWWMADERCGSVLFEHDQLDRTRAVHAHGGSAAFVHDARPWPGRREQTERFAGRAKLHRMRSARTDDDDEVRATCPFCRIVDGLEPAEVVLDTDEALGFLDQRPVFPGHVLVVPRRHVVTLPDLDGADVGGFFRRVQLVSAAVPAALDAHGTFVAVNNVVSQSVAHLHVHVVPRRRKDGLRGFFWPRQRYGDEAEMAECAARIRDEVRRRSA